MILKAIKQAVKKVCPNFMLDCYRDLKLRKHDKNIQKWINQSFMRGWGKY